MRPLLALALVLCFVSSSYAQWFPNAPWNATKQVGAANCPGGICPTNTRWVNRDGLSARDHIEIRHGTNTAGMSESEVLIERDRYHNTYGHSHPVLETASRVATVPMRAANAIPKYRPAASGGGSSGTIRGYGSSGSSVQGYGSSGSSFGVGSVLSDGAVVVSVGQVAEVSSASVEVAAARKSDFRKAFLKAAKTARDSGDITPLQHGRLVVTAMRPRELANIQAWVHENAIQEGMATTQAPDWDALLEFLEKLIPLIIQLIDLFS